MSISVSFDRADRQVSTEAVIRCQVNREFSKYSRTISRGQMHIDTTPEGMHRCSISLRIKGCDDIVVVEAAPSAEQATNVAVHAAIRQLKQVATELELRRRKGTLPSVPSLGQWDW